MSEVQMEVVLAHLAMHQQDVALVVSHFSHLEVPRTGFDCSPVEIQGVAPSLVIENRRNISQIHSWIFSAPM